MLNKGQDGNGAVVVASLALDTPGADDLADFDEKAVPLTANNAVVQGDVLAVDEIVAGAGLAHAGFKLVLQVEAA